MGKKEFDTFVLTDPGMVPEDKEMELILRELTPKDRRYKYRSFYATALVSKSEAKYSDRLWIRLGRGQLQEKPWSVKIIRKLNKFTYRILHPCLPCLPAGRRRQTRTMKILQVFGLGLWLGSPFRLGADGYVKFLNRKT